MTVEEFVQRIRDLRESRRQQRRDVGSNRSRKSLTKDEREEVFAKTAGHCHICGGEITEANWHADHVVRHAAGGLHQVDNFLASHQVCNSARWGFLPEEVQLILQLGVICRTEIEKGTGLGEKIATKHCKKESDRASRRRPV